MIGMRLIEDRILQKVSFLDEGFSGWVWHGKRTCNVDSWMKFFEGSDQDFTTCSF